VFWTPVPEGGCTVTDVVTDKGPCVFLARGTNDYPAGPLLTPFYENGNNEFSHWVGDPAIVCYTPCDLPQYLPKGGTAFGYWFLRVTLELILQGAGQ
jgi:hypothetical protein